MLTHAMVASKSPRLVQITNLILRDLDKVERSVTN